MATLGESNFVYKFYKTAGPLGLLVKKVNGQDLHFMVRFDEKDLTLEQVLDIYHPNWVSETQVIFRSIEGNKNIIFE